MKIETLHQIFLESSGICTDTRKITKNCLFFALRGDNFNGNEFSQEALDKGSLKVVIDDIRFHKNTGETILIRSPLKLLQKLATYHRSYLGIPIIAITGSNGKTTTKELINLVLQKKYKTLATAGNLNNHIGVPLTLLSMNQQTEIGIVEMGANHLKEIEALCAIAKPDFGYITNFGKAHLEGFGSEQGVIQGKTELYAHLSAHQKKVFVNANDPKQLTYSEGLNTIYFGNASQEYHIQLIDASNNLLVRFNDLDIQSALIGLYNFHNIASAIAIGRYFDVSSEKIKEAIEAYTPTNNRSQVIEQGSNRIILDAYNANPTSMSAALENFAQTDGENKVLFLGDMFELGAVAASEHQAITSYLVNNPIGASFLIGDNFYKTQTNRESIQLFRNFDDLKEHLQQHPIENSTVLIKGSRGMALERILDYI